jgi:Beta-xylosidase
MSDPLILTSTDSILSGLHFKRFRSKVERRVVPFLPAPDEPQSLEINTPWGTQLTARKGDFLVSEVATPNDYWAIDPVIFEESYIITRPGYCIKSAITLLAPLTDITGDPEREVTVVTLEGPETVRAGEFYLAKGIKGEIWPYPIEKIDDVMMPAD